MGYRYSLLILYIDGDLGHLIGRNKKQKLKLPEKQILELGIEIAKGVEFIHSKRIVHRDLKPANIFITQDGLPKIGDFGISRILTQEFILSGHVYIYIYIYAYVNLGDTRLFPS